MPPKRKSDASQAGSSKKTALSAPFVAVAQALIAEVLKAPTTFEVPEDKAEVRENFVSLVEYARHLEQQVSDLQQAVQSSSAPKPAKTQAELEAAADKVRNAAVSGIRKQMQWKPSCKTGSAKFAYDGICADPAVFGAMLGLGGPPNWKMKKIPVEEFEKHMGDITASVRYDMLVITSKEVTVRWSEGGEFKISGSYGKHQHN